MMVTDDERREVARRLRQLDPDDSGWNGVRGFDFPYFADALFDAICPNGEEMSSWTERLADLIDPDTTTDTTKSTELTTKCDRDALLELAEEMVEMLRLGAFTGEGLDTRWCRELYDKYASRIREALGVVE